MLYYKWQVDASHQENTQENIRARYIANTASLPLLRARITERLLPLPSVKEESTLEKLHAKVERTEVLVCFRQSEDLSSLLRNTVKVRAIRRATESPEATRRAEAVEGLSERYPECLPEEELCFKQH